MTTRLWLGALALACAGSCDCSGGTGAPRDAAVTPDGGDAAGPEAGSDAGGGGGDGGVGGDGGGDAGPRTGWPGGWERAELLPEECDAWVPRGDPAEAARHLHFGPCEPAEPGCERLLIEWERAAVPHNAVIAGDGFQTWGDAPILNLSIPFETTFDSYEDFTLYRLDGTPVAVWRIWQTRETAADGRCRQSAVAWHDGEVAVGFWVRDGDRVTAEFEVSIIAGELERIQWVTEPRFRLGEREVLSRGNVPDQLLYDGTSVVIQGLLGAVYLGSLGGEPWGQLATCPTGDSGNGHGMLYEGALYWAGSPCEGPGWTRFRRRVPGASSNETFMQRDDGHLQGLRADGERAVWIETLDWDPVDGRTERARIRVAETGGSMEPESWSPRVVREHPRAFGRAQPVMADGTYAYMFGDSQLELLDLEANRRLTLTPPEGMYWSRLLYLGPEYLFVVTADGRVPFSGMRRYRIDELEGWVPIE